MKRFFLQPLPILLAIVLVAGCEKPGPIRSNIIGTVSYRGEPLTTGEVQFFSAGGGEPSRAVIGRDGTYRMSETLSGQYRVAITTPTKPAAGKKASARPNAPTPVYIPNKYAKPDTSGLTANVPETNTTIDFKLD